MIGEFNEYETQSLIEKGYLMVDDIARKSNGSAWETVRVMDGKIYHQGKDPYGNKIDQVYNTFQNWEEAQQKF